jgi:hypothetical protein
MNLIQSIKIPSLQQFYSYINILLVILDSKCFVENLHHDTTYKYQDP